MCDASAVDCCQSLAACLHLSLLLCLCLVPLLFRLVRRMMQGCLALCRGSRLALSLRPGGAQRLLSGFRSKRPYIPPGKVESTVTPSKDRMNMDMNEVRQVRRCTREGEGGGEREKSECFDRERVRVREGERG